VIKNLPCLTCGLQVVPKNGRCPHCQFKVIDFVDPVLVMQVHIVSDFDPKKPGEMGWVHTHGLSKFKLPELEIRNVPLFLGPAATGFLNGLAGYMLNGPKPIKVGETYGTGPMAICRVVKADPIVNDPDVIATHYQTERWLLSDDPLRGVCKLH
jgi:hypothetical protein